MKPQNTKAGGSVGLDNQTSAGNAGSVGAPGGYPQPAREFGANILDRDTGGAASGGISNDIQTLTSDAAAPASAGPADVAVEQAYQKPTSASTTSALTGDLP